jgi:hypothetical protein
VAATRPIATPITTPGPNPPHLPVLKP